MANFQNVEPHECNFVIDFYGHLYTGITVIGSENSVKLCRAIEHSFTDNIHHCQSIEQNNRRHIHCHINDADTRVDPQSSHSMAALDVYTCSAGYTLWLPLMFTQWLPKILTPGSST